MAIAAVVVEKRQVQGLVKGFTSSLNTTALAFIAVSHFLQRMRSATSFVNLASHFAEHLGRDYKSVVGKL